MPSVFLLLTLCQIFMVSFERCIIYAVERYRGKAVQGHRRSLILRPIENAYVTSY